MCFPCWGLVALYLQVKWRAASQKKNRMQKDRLWHEAHRDELKFLDPDYAEGRAK